MSTDKLFGERARALEDAFFHEAEEKALADYRQKLQSQQTRADLSNLLGQSDSPLIDSLVGLGMSASTFAALSLVPLVSVAWADDVISDEERAEIERAAVAKGLSSESQKLLSLWLSRKPSPQLFSAWEIYARSLVAKLETSHKQKLAEEISSLTENVAKMAGGFLGIGAVSAKERTVLNAIKAVFA